MAKDSYEERRTLIQTKESVAAHVSKTTQKRQ